MNRARESHARGDLAGAVRGYETVLQLDPGNFEATYLLAVAFYQAGQLERAVEGFAAAARIDPRRVEPHKDSGLVLMKLGRNEAALASFETATRLAPDAPELFLNRGIVQRNLGRIADSMESYRTALRLNPRFAEAHNSMGNIQSLLGQRQEALNSYTRAFTLKPDYTEAHVNAAILLQRLGREADAIPVLEKALAADPGNAEAYLLLGSLKFEMGDADGGLKNLDGGLRVLAGGKPAALAVVEDCIRLLSVENIPGIYATEADVSKSREMVESLLNTLDRTYDGHSPLAADQTVIAEKAIRQLTGFYIAYHQRNDRETMAKLSRVSMRLLSLPRYEITARPNPRGRIRLGVASQLMRNHNGSNYAYNWLANLPQADYEIFTYSIEPANDELSAKFAALGTHRELTWSRSRPYDIVQQMRQDELDMLFLTDVGMTAVSRFLAIHRIAPCQFTSWSHPVTTGSPEMDFFLTSDLMEPENGQDHYTEKLVRLPNLTLYIDEDKEDHAPTPPAYFGLPEGRVLYGCLQSLFKYLPRYDDILPRIALEVPEALFVHLEGFQPYMTGIMKERLERSFGAHGLDAARHVVFLPRQKPDDFDRLMRAMDVCIDSVGWSGGHTTLRNIRFGVPLATLPGELMRGRHSTAMFRMIGAEELITESQDDYVDRLVRLGREKAYRQHCAGLFRQGRYKLYRDQTFIDALDTFLKSRAGPA